MEINLKIDTQYRSQGTQRASDVRVLTALAKALDEQPVDVSIYSATHNAERARDNCALAENVASVTGIDVDAPFADAKGEPTTNEKAVQAVANAIDAVENAVAETTSITPETVEASRAKAVEDQTEKPKRKRRTKKEMEAARAAEAVPNNTPVDDAIDAALSTLDDAVGTDIKPDTTEPAPTTVPTDVDPAKAMRDIMVKFVNRFQSKGTLIMAKIVEDLTGETNILKVSKENFGPVFDALTARLDAPVEGEGEKEDAPEAKKKEDALDY